MNRLDISKAELAHLYETLSITELKNRLRCGYDRLYYTLDEYGLRRERYKKFNADEPIAKRKLVIGNYSIYLAPGSTVEVLE